MDSPLVLAVALDPRFRKLSFLSNAEQDKVHDVLVEKVITFDHGFSCSSKSDEPPLPPVKKKSNVLDHLLGEEVDQDDDESSRMTERLLSFYRSAQCKEDPLALVAGQYQPFSSSCCCGMSLLSHTCYLYTVGKDVLCRWDCGLQAPVCPHCQDDQCLSVLAQK